MGGGLIQLQYLGREADFFIGNPQISFFKSIFKSYSNFSKELINILFESPISFNTNTYLNIPIHADLIQNMYINMNLNLNVKDSFTIQLNVTNNDLKFSSTEECVFYEFNSTNNEELVLYNYKYKISDVPTSLDFKVYNINSNVNLYENTNTGHYLNLQNSNTDTVIFQYNSNGEKIIYVKIRDLTEDLTKLFKEITFEIDEYVIEKHSNEWLLAYNKMFNNNDTLSRINGQIKNISSKMFNKNIQLYIPLRFFFTKDTTCALPIAALHKSDVNIRIKTSSMEETLLCHKIVNNVTFNQVYIAANYFYLDKEEKEYFLKNNHRLLIEQVQQQSATILNNNYSNIELHFTYLSKFLLWKLPYKYILDKAKIIFNNNDLFYEQHGEYFHLIQLMEHNLGDTDSLTRMEENIDTNGTYYLYSFCLYPNNRQPSGLCNMSRIDDKFLQLYTLYIKDNINTNVKIPIEVFNVNYNFLYIENGKCKLEF